MMVTMPAALVPPVERHAQRQIAIAKRRAAAVSRSTGREMRRASGAVARPTTSSTTVTIKSGA